MLERHRVVLKAMAKIAIDDRLPEGTGPDLASVKAVIMEDGLTYEAASSLLEDALSDGVINFGEYECALS